MKTLVCAFLLAGCATLQSPLQERSTCEICEDTCLPGIVASCGQTQQGPWNRAEVCTCKPRPVEAAAVSDWEF